MEKNHLWGIQTTFESKKYLTFQHKGGKTLYFSDTNKVVPVLFETKDEAKKAIKNHCKTKEKDITKRLFRNVLEGASCGKPVKVKVQILN